MGWVRIDDAMPEHRKYIEAGPLASWMAVAALAWCNRHLTNGFIPTRKVATLVDFSGFGEVDSTHQSGDRLSCVKVEPHRLAHDLVELGIWEHVVDGYYIHDYDRYQRSADEIRGLSETRADAGRKGARSRWGREASQPQGSSNDDIPADSGDGPPMAPPMANGIANGCPNPNPKESKSKPLSPDGDGRALFDPFWQVFPKRNGRKIGKGDAEKVWRRLKPDEISACLVAVGNYAMAVEAGQTIAADAHRWLTKRRWVDWQERTDDSRPVSYEPRQVTYR